MDEVDKGHIRLLVEDFPNSLYRGEMTSPRNLVLGDRMKAISADKNLCP